MSEDLLSSTVESDTHEIVFRNVARVLFDEGEVPDDRKRCTRVSARFDRTHWVPEIYHPFEPTRSQPKVNRSFNGTLSKKHAEPKNTAQHGHTKERLEAVQMHGIYKLIEVFSTPCERGLKVKAQCTGQSCGGQAVRVFRARDWLDLRENKSCPRCHGEVMRVAADERYRATVKMRHGMYEFVSMQRQGQTKAMTVTGRCTGSKCGGFQRTFQFSHWQVEKNGMDGCFKCCPVVRGRPFCKKKPANEVAAEQGAA